MNLNIIKRILPEQNMNRLRIHMIPKYITIHEVSLGTHEEPLNHNINFYYNQLLHPEPGREKISYHYIVDDTQIINFVPDNEKCYHCGDGEYGTGNSYSIGIERCVFKGIHHTKAISKQAMLTAHLMHKYNIPIQNVVPHSIWRNTPCPERLQSGMYGGWNNFILLVTKYYNKESC